MYDFPCCTTSIHSPHSVIVADPDWSTRWAFCSLRPLLRVLMSSSSVTAAATLYLLPSLSGWHKRYASWIFLSLCFTSVIKTSLGILNCLSEISIIPKLRAHLQLDIATGFPWNWCRSFFWGGITKSNYSLFSCRQISFQCNSVSCWESFWAFCLRWQWQLLGCWWSNTYSQVCQKHPCICECLMMISFLE